MAAVEPKPAHNTNGHIENGGGAIENGSNYQGGPAVSRFVTAGGNPIDTSQPAFPSFHRKFGNPAPLGLLGFGATTFVLSMYNVNARHVTNPNVVLGMALGYGGLAQLIAGIEEWACGNTFGATAFSSYGGFWLSFATIYIPQFEVTTAYATPGELDSALGIYLCAWGIVTFLFLVSCLRSSLCLVGLFFFLDITFWCLAGGFLGGSTKAIKAGGAFGILTAAIAGYTGLAGMLTRDTSHFLIPVGDLSKSRTK